MAYAREDAEREVGDSTNWLVGLGASIKKYKQRVAGDVGSYQKTERCGLCFVADNRGIDRPTCTHCLASSICARGVFTIDTSEEILQALKKLRKELDPMDCSKPCANFKPKDESPFPEGLKTEDLKVGMVVCKGNDDRHIYTILKPPRGIWVKVLLATLGSEPIKTEILLADYGCQPYGTGAWHSRNWLREVK